MPALRALSHEPEATAPASAVEVTDAPDSAPQASSVRLAPHRADARAWVAQAADLARATTRTSLEQLARALDVAKTQAGRLCDPGSGKALALGDVVAAAEAGRREWAIALLTSVLARLVDARPAPPAVAPETAGLRVAAATGRYQAELVDALDDGVIDARERADLLAAIAQAHRALDAAERSILGAAR
jgi:hypothetical protein